MTNMLMITTTVGMFNWIHSNTTNLGPRVALDAVFVVGAASLEHGLFSTTATGNLANGGTAVAADNLLAARGELNTGDAGIGVVGNDDGVVARAARHGATVACLFLNVADDGAFRHLADGLDIADGEGGVSSAVDVLAGVDTFGGNEELLVLLIANGVSEFNLGQRSTTSRIVEDVGDYTTDVAMAFSGIQSAELCGSFAVGVVRFEHRPRTLTLGADDATHLHT